MIKLKKMALSMAALLTVGQAIAIEATEKSCTDAVSALGLPTTPYEFKDGFFGNKHLFGDSVECSDSGGHLIIKSGRKTVAEDGFYGEAALAAKAAVLASQSDQIEVLRDEKRRKEDVAEQEFKAARLVIENDAMSQLELIQKNEIPPSISAAIESSRLEEAEKQTLKAEERERKAQRKAREKEIRAASRAKKEAKKKRSGQHCVTFSTNPYAATAVERRLNDPDSFDHDQTVVFPVEDGRHEFVMTFRAKNAFGGVVMGKAIGSFSTEDCSNVVIESME